MIVTREKAFKLRTIIEQAVASLDDATALEAVTLYPAWAAGVTYDLGVRVRYNDILYKVITAHISQEDWTPDSAVSLFTKVLIPDENIIYEWEQPESTNPYKKGDKVTHNGKTWVSLVDGNVWEPGYYGWEEIA